MIPIAKGSTTPRIALITGANRGIGRSTAMHLAQDGVDVIITYRTHADEADAVVRDIEELGRTAVALQLDVGEVKTFDTFAADVHSSLERTWGRDSFDHLVNNGGMQIAGTFVEVTEEDFDRLVDVHFKGVFFLTQKLLPLIADNGSIVTLSSALARSTGPERVVYGSSALARSIGPKRLVYGSVKGAVEVFTRYLAAELGPRGITANTIAPGSVATDFSDGLLRDIPHIQQMTISATALGRIAVADDIGSAIAALLGEGNHWVTGQRIEVSGGLHL